MKVVPSRKIYNLVHSVTKGEKRTFTAMSGMYRRDTPSYVKLFREISKIKPENADTPSINLKNHSKTRGSFAQMQLDLYEKILQSLRFHYDSHANQDIELQIHQSLIDTHLLFRRGLFEQAYERLTNAKREALKYGQYMQMPNILNWEKKLIMQSGRDLTQRLAQLREEEKQVMDKVNNISSFVNIQNQLLVINRQDGILRKQDRLTALKDFVENSLLNNPKNAICLEAQLIYHTCNALYHHISDKIEAAYQHYWEIIHIMDRHEHIREYNLLNYMRFMINIIFCCTQLHYYKDISTYIEKIEALQKSNKKPESRIFYLMSTAKLEAYTLLGEFQKGIQVITEVQQKFNEQWSPGIKLSLYIQFARIYFGAAQYEMALDWLDRINERNQKHRSDLVAFAKVFKLLIYHEMDYNLLVSNRAKNVIRFLRNRGRMYQSELNIVRFLENRINILNKRELKMAFQELKNKLLELEDIPSERIFLGYFDFIAWIDSKLTNQTFASLIQQQAAMQ